jgi:hypothetical protein
MISPRVPVGCCTEEVASAQESLVIRLAGRPVDGDTCADEAGVVGDGSDGTVQAAVDTATARPAIIPRLTFISVGRGPRRCRNQT